jgi:hypothetical protein
VDGNFNFAWQEGSMRNLWTLPALVLAAGSAMVTAAPAQANITSFIVYHSQSYTQDASGLSAPVLSVETITTTSSYADFDGGSVTAPDGSTVPVINQGSPGYPQGQFGAYFGPQPFGTFTVNLSNSMTLATDSASLSYASDHYPNVAPQVSNYAALQHFDPTVDNGIVLQSGFAVPAGATDASTTFFIYDEATLNRLLQYSLAPSATVFDVPSNTATPGEKIGYYFEFDVDYDATVNGVTDVNVYRDITIGDINAAAAVPEPETWALMLLGVAALGAIGRGRRAAPAG